MSDLSKGNREERFINDCESEFIQARTELVTQKRCRNRLAAGALLLFSVAGIADRTDQQPAKELAPVIVMAGVLAAIPAVLKELEVQIARDSIKANVELAIEGCESLGLPPPAWTSEAPDLLKTVFSDPPASP